MKTVFLFAGMAVAAVSFFSALVMVMAASEVRIGLQDALQVVADRVDHIAAYPADDLDSRLCERLQRASADSAAEQKFHIIRWLF